MVMHSNFGSKKHSRKLNQLLMGLESQKARPDLPGHYLWNGTDWGLSQKEVKGWPRADIALSANSMLVCPQLKEALLSRTNDPELRDLIEAVEDAKISTLYALRMDVDTPEFVRIWNDAVDALAPRTREVSVTATGKVKKFVPYHTQSGYTRH